MTYEERKKWICEQCNQKTDCAYVNRNMEYKCLLVEERMERPTDWICKTSDGKWHVMHDDEYHKFNPHKIVGVKIEQQ